MSRARQRSRAGNESAALSFTNKNFPKAGCALPPLLLRRSRRLKEEEIDD